MPQSSPNKAVEDRVIIADEVIRCFIPGKCFDQLLHNPRRSWYCRYNEVNDPSAGVIDDDKAIKEFESDRRNDYKVHRSDALPIVLKEGLPSLPAAMRLVFIIYLATVVCETE